MTTIDSTSDEVRVAEIAAGLTDAQRRVFDFHVGVARPTATSGQIATELSLLLDGLLEINRDGHLIISDVGLAVRAHLLATRTNNDG